MEREVRYCTSEDGCRIAYSTSGEGHPLIRALGWLSHLELESRTPLWRATNEGLSAAHQFTRYDGRGTGLSGPAAGALSLGTYVSDLTAVAEATKLERFALIGISQGGASAVAYAARHPERVSHLILYGAFAHRFLELPFIDSLVGLIRQGWETPAVRQLFSAAFLPGGDPEEAGWFSEFQQASASADVASQMMDANAKLDVVEIAPLVSAPTLVIHRRGDAAVPFEAGRELASLIPNARFLPLDGDNHLFLDGEPELQIFLDAVDEFTGQRAGVRTPPIDRHRRKVNFRTILFTDLVGHTEMMSRLGDERGRDVLREHERITREVLKANGGTEVKTMGDGFMASFGSVTKAVECAIALQRAFADREGEPLNVRVGLNAGEPIEEDGDLFGATVILASRIAAKADGGEILVADTVRGLCSGKGFWFADRGDFVAKGFEEPMRVYQVSWRDTTAS